MFKKVLVANRGEIACRVIRACHMLGVKAVSIYSQADADSRHVSMADESVCIGPGTNVESYLNAPNVLMAAEITGCDAVHPGFGYFSENDRFAEEVAVMGLKFIGPSVEAIRAMGDKASAKEAAVRADCPVVPGSDGVVEGESEAARIAAEIGYPVVMKACAGGGGRGIRRVNSADELVRNWDMARQEAQASFGDAGMIIEKCVVQPRHVEIQVLGDEHGRLVYLGERECSIQNRRHQKIVEEAPCAFITESQRREMGEAAVRVARTVGYSNAGTMEFLLDQDGKFYFLEMNTRIQVEHGVTEEVTGFDLVQWQIRIAAGEPLDFTQGDVAIRGHAIEARITAQDPDKDFAPSTGKITKWNPPGFGGVRLDTHVSTGFIVAPFYDPMIAKLIVKGKDRAEAVRLLAVALQEFEVEGIQTNIPFLRRLVADADYRSGNVDTGFVDRFLTEAPVEV
ncbi:MAG: acetyl-CoA carboxylase biotin carboxylase subunit [Fimbriimonadaceae bacterium]|nr:acetyl-CoA carboxylase biotin carboxylase subunit [Fimbriimonadaceae bacterium]QYK56188.1 MAG: acetyl-CoA carboxylase biotin carboxylase subunit [Fimbriimonadaceae bacterium]